MTVVPSADCCGLGLLGSRSDLGLISVGSRSDLGRISVGSRSDLGRISVNRKQFRVPTVRTVSTIANHVLGTISVYVGYGDVRCLPPLCVHIW